MKRIVVIIIVLSFTLGVQAQNWAPTGAVWHYSKTYPSPFDIQYVKVESLGDTVVSGKVCKLVSKNNSALCDGRPLREAMYSENDKVYFYEDSLGFQLLYDFSAIAGATWEIYLHRSYPGGVDTIKVKVDSLSTTVINSQTLKIYYDTYVVPSHGEIIVASHGTVIERLGNMHYMFPWNYDDCDIAFGGPLRCYQDAVLGLYNTGEASKCDYENTNIDELHPDDEISVYPNPFITTTTIYLGFSIENKDNLQVVLYDVLGKEVKRIEGITTNEVQVHRENLLAGIYYYQLNSEASLIKTGKLVVE